MSDIGREAKAAILIGALALVATGSESDARAIVLAREGAKVGKVAV
jgi:hypothetical protein